MGVRRCSIRNHLLAEAAVSALMGYPAQTLTEVCVRPTIASLDCRPIVQRRQTTPGERCTRTSPSIALPRSSPSARRCSRASRMSASARRFGSSWPNRSASVAPRHKGEGEAVGWRVRIGVRIGVGSHTPTRTHFCLLPSALLTWHCRRVWPSKGVAANTGGGVRSARWRRGNLPRG